MPYFESPDGSVQVELKNRNLAALFAWLLPGAGHVYQGRYVKGALLGVTILVTFFVGLSLGSGRVVYASNDENDWRWHYYVQAMVGAPAFPAIIQAMHMSTGADPLWVMAERYPADTATPFDRITADSDYEGNTLKDGFMAPPAGPVDPNHLDVLGKWHEELQHNFDIGTLYTFIAGLLNLLAVYDAYAGPAMFPHPSEDEEGKDTTEKTDQ